MRKGPVFVYPTFIAHILIVDDDHRLRDLLKRYMQRQNFLVSTASSLAEAKHVLSLFVMDVVVLDVMMPKELGWNFFQIKDICLPPVVFLSAMGNPKDRMQGLSLGAKDYVLKPFEPEELLIRIQNILKVSRKHTLQFGDLVYHQNRSQVVHKNGNIIHLTDLETQILTYMGQRLHQPVSREELLHHFFPQSKTLRVVDVNIGRLRKKIEEDSASPRFLLSLRNKGYILKGLDS
jgi:two-component system phosphate regulon response regulator OmpR